MISIVKIHIRNYLDDIFHVVRDFWTPQSSLQITLINVIEQIVVALGSEFRVYVNYLIPHILRVFAHDNSLRKQVTIKMLGALQNFGVNLDDYLHLVLPPIIKLFDSTDQPMNVRICALETIDVFSEDLQITDYASRIIHAIVRTIETASSSDDVSFCSKL